MNNRKEYILCAAIKRKEPNTCKSPYHEGTNDILSIEIGYRHHDIYMRFGYPTIQDSPLSYDPNDQGFYTSYGRFVSRKEAARIALECGQISRPTEDLFSEDLY